MAGRRAPTWLSRIVVDAVHTDQLRTHGGMAGLRDENALESALARPRNKWSYNPHASLATLAAAYGFGLVKNHPYRDGNKRVGFLATVTFLELNGYELVAREPEMLTVMLALADGRLSEDKLAEWIQQRINRIK